MYRIVLPLLGEYADAGHRHSRTRLIYSFRSNIRYQLIVLACLVVGLLYLLFSTNVKIGNPKALVMALAYAWGLILAIYLMGHGLVALPRRLFRGASISGRMKQYEAHAPSVHDRLTESIDELNLLEGQVLQLMRRKNGLSTDFQEWIEELGDTSNLSESQAGQLAAESASVLSVPTVVTERYLADLTRRLKRARHKRIRFIEEWDYLMLQVKCTKAILGARSSRKLEANELPCQSSILSKFCFLPSSVRYHLHANVIPAGRVGLSGILALASVCVIWSEMFKTKSSLCIVGLSIVHLRKSAEGEIGFAGQVTASFWLLYMCIAALASIHEVKIWGNRALVRRHTYAESACWYACQVAKLTVPLAYNFVTFLDPEIHENTAFYSFLGNLINLTPLGTGFSRFFPIFILIPVLATTFNLYSRLRAVAGFGSFMDDDGGAFNTSQDGRALIERELQSTSAGANVVGLSTRDTSPDRLHTPRTPQERHRLLDQPLTAGNPGIGRSHGRKNIAARRELEASEDNSNIFSDFAHRVKNTIESTNRPAWMKALDTNGGINRPKWLGGIDGNTESTGRAPVNGLGRWLGGRPDDGRLRL